MQAKVFQLADDTGKPTGKVIKINHGDIGSKMLNNNVRGCLDGLPGGWACLGGGPSERHARMSMGPSRQRTGFRGHDRHGLPGTWHVATSWHDMHCSLQVVWVGMDREWEVGTQASTAHGTARGRVS
jgi:hypothetical protein